ncbi:MAG TPA: rod shape-determining protein RodA [Actinomycetota bacterium]|nr:rod shape-determining protein RodA [Actinomycetota bacterium]
MDVSAGRSLDVGAGRLLASERSPLRHLDPMLVVTTLALTIYGLMLIYSATHQSIRAFDRTADPGLFMKKQFAFMLLGLIAMILVATFDYRLAKVYAPITYGAVVILLLLVMTPLGNRTLGAQRWITLFGFQFQPSEIAKLAVIAMLAAHLSEIQRGLRLEDVWRATGLVALPMGLVFLQPDVGTSMAFAAILLGVLVVAGAKAKHLGVLTLASIFAVFLAFRVGIVQEYQLARLRAFIDPSADPLRAGYNIEQSRIAIGSGGLGGKGYLQGTQTNLDFVPQQHTDFVFTVVGEEFGFLGGMLLLLLFALLLWRGIRIAMLSKDAFGTLLATGIVSVVAFQVFVNVGMTLGIMPVTGIPLPFVSYGGTALVTNFLAVGLLMNIHMRRFK